MPQIRDMPVLFLSGLKDEIVPYVQNVYYVTRWLG